MTSGFIWRSTSKFPFHRVLRYYQSPLALAQTHPAGSAHLPAADKAWSMDSLAHPKVHAATPKLLSGPPCKAGIRMSYDTTKVSPHSSLHLIYSWSPQKPPFQPEVPWLRVPAWVSWKYFWFDSPKQSNILPARFLTCLLWHFSIDFVQFPDKPVRASPGQQATALQSAHPHMHKTRF